MPSTLMSPHGQHLVQAAGHGLLRLSDTRRDAVVKPTTENEVKMYGMLRSDPILANLRGFTPRFFGSCPRPATAPNSKYPFEVEMENLCMFDRESLVDSHDHTSEEDAKSRPAHSSDNDFVGSERSHDSDDSKGDRAEKKSRGKRKTVRTQWSAPSVLDVKVGRVKHTPCHTLERITHMQDKDKGSTSDVHGIRICGLRHERRIVDVSFAAEAPAIEPAGEMSRVDAVQKSCPASANSSPTDVDSDADPAASSSGPLRSETTIDSLPTLERQRREPRTKTPSPHAPSLPQARTAVRRAVLGRRHEWTEGKSFGRRIELDGFRRAFAKFCTCIETSNQPVSLRGTSPLSATVGTLDFDPNPHRPLLSFYHEQLVALRKALDETRVLEHYSFTSSSLIFVHDFHVRVGVRAARRSFDEASPSAGRKSQAGVTFRAKLRLVDFSSSGKIEAGEVYDDNIVGFMFGLNNLITVFEELLAEYPEVNVERELVPGDEDDAGRLASLLVADGERRASTDSADTPRILLTPPLTNPSPS